MIMKGKMLNANRIIYMFSSLSCTEEALLLTGSPTTLEYSSFNLILPQKKNLWKVQGVRKIVAEL